MMLPAQESTLTVSTATETRGRGGLSAESGCGRFLYPGVGFYGVVRDGLLEMFEGNEKRPLCEILGKDFHAEGTFNDHQAETNVACREQWEGPGGTPGTSHLLTLCWKSPCPDLLLCSRRPRPHHLVSNARLPLATITLYFLTLCSG